MDKKKEILGNVFLKKNLRLRIGKDSQEAVFEAMDIFAEYKATSSSSKTIEEAITDFFYDHEVEKEYLTRRLHELICATRYCLKSSDQSIPADWVEEINKIKERLKELS